MIQDRGYDERGGGVMETMLQDVKYALRQLGRQPSVLDPRRPDAGARHRRLDGALQRHRRGAAAAAAVSESRAARHLDVEETGADGKPGVRAVDVGHSTWRTLTTIVSQAGMGRVSGFVPLIVDTGTPERLTVAEASEGFLETYGITPILGRGIHADDTRDGAPAVALLGHAYWQREFGGDPNVLGRGIRIQNRPVTIVGVLPAGFYNETAVWQASSSTPHGSIGAVPARR